MNILNEEIWKPIKDFETTHEISNWGRIKRIAPGTGTYVGRILKPYRRNKGYLLACLSGKRLKTASRQVHVIVMEAFVGPRPLGMQINHKDGNKTNNELSNLEYVTPKQNIHHAITNKLYNVDAESRPCAKIDYKKSDDIRLLYAFGISTRDLSRVYGISFNQVHKIVTNRAWVKDLWLKNLPRNELILQKSA